MAKQQGNSRTSKGPTRVKPTTARMRAPGAGAPSKLTPVLQERMCELVRKGNFLEVCCARVGLERGTFYDWLKRGIREPKSIYGDFRIAIEAAEAEAEASLVEVIKDDETWASKAWMLTKRFKTRWANNPTNLRSTDGSSPKNEPVATPVAYLPALEVDEPEPAT